MKKRALENRSSLHMRLEYEVEQRNNLFELSHQKPDPLLVASQHRDEFIALICALFSYGNAKHIVAFLESFDFSLLDKNEAHIQQALQHYYYRFQSPQDIQELFITLNRVKKETSLESLFSRGYLEKNDVMCGLKELITYLYDINTYRSKGYQFLLGKIPQKPYDSAYKRWHMFLRWMVRSDHLDLGLWHSVSCKDLLIPLDVHTFRVGKKLGLITRNSCDFKAVLELTQSLRDFDVQDPVKFDFALYRIGQEKIIV